MKTQILLISLMVNPFSVISQNLIQNHSFESYTNNVGGFINGPGDGYLSNYWNLEATTGTPDYFNPNCNNVNYRVPNNITGYLPAHDGNAYMGIATFSQINPNVAEYIATNVTLNEGATYEFKMNVSLASSCGFITPTRPRLQRGRSKFAFLTQ